MAWDRIRLTDFRYYALKFNPVRFTFSLLVFLFFANLSPAQLGCTDPQAQNYNPDATENDGSCTYGLTEYVPQEVAILPDLMRECSGVEFLPSGLWALNDGGNEDKIYQLDTTNGNVLESIIIATADNIDWEDITEDESYIYIGDFGNNPGNRTDLQIHRVSKSDLQSTVVNSEIITFEYSDQVDFTENPNNHNFDCEAFFYHNDSLHLFSKNWADNQTKHYVLPALPGNHVAQLVETFNVSGLVTGADISENGEIALIGYDGIVNFMWVLFDYQGTLFFSGNKRRISLGIVINNSQTEGITFRGDGYGYICSEEIVYNQFEFPPKLLSFSIKQWTDNSTSTAWLDNSYQLNAYPNPVKENVQIEWSRPIDGWWLYNTNGELLMQQDLAEPVMRDEINMEHLTPGIYILKIEKDRRSKSIELLKL